MRNLTGSAHVSEKWDDSFASLERKNPAGLVFFNNNKHFIPEFGPEYGSIRQIAYELGITLRNNCSDVLHT